MEYPTFFEACKAMNLIEDDELWFKTMEEAVAEYNQVYLIRLLAYIFVFNEVNDPRKLWDRFKGELMR